MFQSAVRSDEGRARQIVVGKRPQATDFLSPQEARIASIPPSEDPSCSKQLFPDPDGTGAAARAQALVLFMSCAAS